MRQGSKPQDANVVSLAGGQTIGRAVALLKLVATSGGGGLSLAEIAERSGLHRATAHRLLGVLAAERLIAQDGEHCYRAGVELWMLGEAAARRFGLSDAGRHAIERVARETEDTAYLTIRSGFAAVCVGRAEGAFPIRTLSLSVGDRRPLGIGSGSLALLAWLEPAEREQALAAAATELEPYPRFTPPILRRQVEETRRRGYSFVGGTILPGMSAVGVPVLDGGGQVLAALSVAAIDARLAEPRRTQVVAILKAQARALAASLSSAGKAPGAAPARRRKAGHG